jgi:hypothetical protein
MLGPLLTALLATLARALVAHACGEALRLLLEHVAPGMPPLVCIAVGLLTGVTLVELIVTIWHRRSGPHDPS